MPRPVVLVVDGAAGFLAKASVGFGVVKVEVVKAKVFELVFGEAQLPGNINPPDGGALLCGQMKGMVSWLSS